ncbi:MAG: translesion error-prone DNA polymerase V autoproteolytic subunit [Bacteroidales bacterium]|nr:translesion error-prone DNA polymerase V autoproteolytic subunit [Bacteroidales bacterium]
MSSKENKGVKLDIYSAASTSENERPLLPFGISAGFPSPALDFIDVTIDLNKELIKHPAATFYGKVQGESMKNAGINDRDLIVIDKSIDPSDGKIAVCYLDGEFTLKRLKIDKTGLWLLPENEKYQPIKIEEENNLTVWGVVTYVIKKLL